MIGDEARVEEHVAVIHQKRDDGHVFVWFDLYLVVGLPDVSTTPSVPFIYIRLIWKQNLRKSVI